MSNATLQLDNYSKAGTGNFNRSANKPPGNLKEVSSLTKLPTARAQTAEEMTPLIALIAEQGDRQAFVKVFKYFGPRVKSFLVFKGLTQAAADDVLQEVMLAVWQKASSYDPAKAKLSTWVFTIARYKYIDRLRSEGCRPTETANFDLHESENMLADDEVLQEQRQDAVQAAIANLPRKHRSVIFLSFVKGLAHSEIAEQLGLPLGTVKSRIRRSFAQLREELGTPKTVVRR
jgi:RNA polymerase sigma-70 factor (ECF subfamily)